MTDTTDKCAEVSLYIAVPFGISVALMTTQGVFSDLGTADATYVVAMALILMVILTALSLPAIFTARLLAASKGVVLLFLPLVLTSAFLWVGVGVGPDELGQHCFAWVISMLCIFPVYNLSSWAVSWFCGILSF